jgi:amidohydrolase
MKLKDKIKEAAALIQSDIIHIRRHLHAHPELSFQEFETHNFISEKLTEFGIPHIKNYGGTGISGQINGAGKNLKTICLRADIDALPIHELNSVEYISKNPGVMHACGHDVHSASLLGTLRLLQNFRNELKFNVKFVFQPGEEKLPGGAKLMIEAGLLKNPKPDFMIGQHVFPSLETGKLGFRSGMYMASSDEIYITIKGKGGHAGTPHLNIDPVYISAQVIIALQQLVSRNANPNTPTVLSFGKVMANGATNVIPSEVKIEGTFRTMNEKWRKEAHQLIREIVQNTSKASGGQCEINILKGYPFLVNDPKTTEFARQKAIEFLGAENVVELEPRMASEDFAWYSQQVPSCFYRLGTGNKTAGINSNVHTPTFNIDENALEIGMGFMAWLAL